MGSSTLLPNIEQRLSGWVKIHDRQAVPAARRVRPTLTLSREYGCEGFPLAEALKSLFEEATGEDWTLFDRSLIEHIARAEGIPERILRNLGDMPRAFDALGFKPIGADLTQDGVFDKVAQCMAPLAIAGNAIVVGRGASILCRNLQNCFHFRLVASLRWRVDCYSRRAGVPLAEAEETVRARSEQRAGFISRHLGANIADPILYDAIFNNERHRVEDVARAIFAYVRSAWPEPELFAARRVARPAGA